MEFKGINLIVAAIMVMSMVITANSEHPYTDCFKQCAPACFASGIDQKCLINCDVQCHGAALDQFEQHCKDTCLKIKCAPFTDDSIHKTFCTGACTKFCHAKA